MAALSDYLENKILDHILRATAYTAPATVYVGLLTAAPNDAGGGTEASGTNYARVGVTSGTSAWNNTQGNTTGASTGTDGTIENAAAVNFATPDAIAQATAAGALAGTGTLAATAGWAISRTPRNWKIARTARTWRIAS